MPLNLISKLLNKTSERVQSGFLSPFGGFWTDRHERAEHLDRLQKQGSVNAEEAALLRFWMENGYAIIPGVLDEAQTRQVQAAIDGAIDAGSRQMTYWDTDGKHQGPARRDKLGMGECKVIDVHATLPEVQAAIFAPKLARFFELVMEAKALAFQTLYFEHGSEQGVHQDTAFVYVDPPLEFVASWIALEDIEPGSGELMYHPGSHRLPDLLFGDPPSKALLPGDPAASSYSATLGARCDAAGLQRQLFRPRRGDALVWAADLAHGGSPRTSPKTRRSLVTHYCPLHRRPPYASGAQSAPIVMANGHAVLSQT